LSILEPVGAKAPTFSSDSKGSIFERSIHASFALLCQAQAFPVPIIRQVSVDRIFGNTSLTNLQNPLVPGLLHSPPTITPSPMPVLWVRVLQCFVRLRLFQCP